MYELTIAAQSDWAELHQRGLRVIVDPFIYRIGQIFLEGTDCGSRWPGLSDNYLIPMPEILVEVRPPGAAGDLTGQPAIPESFMNRVEDLGKSLRDIAERLSQQLEHFEKKPAAAWRLENVELKFSLDLEAEAGVVIARTKTSAGFEASLSWKLTSA